MKAKEKVDEEFNYIIPNDYMLFSGPTTISVDLSQYNSIFKRIKELFRFVFLGKMEFISWQPEKK